MFLIGIEVSPAMAAIIEYTDRSAFNAATTGLTTLDFENLGTPSNGFIHHVGGLVYGGVTFTDSKNLLYTIGPSYYPSYIYGTGVVLSSQGGHPFSDSILTVQLPGGITAVGTDLGNNGFPKSSFIVTLSNGDVFNVTGGTPTGRGGSGFSFVGFTSTLAIASISFDAIPTGSLHNDDSGYIPSYDNFTFGSASAGAVPEPSSFALFCLGGLGLVTRACRRCQTVVA